MAYEIWNGDDGDFDISAGGNYISDSAPTSAGSALFPAMPYDAGDVVAGSDFSAVLLVDFVVNSNNFLTFGSIDTYLQIDADYFEFSGEGGFAYFDIENSGDVRILNAPSAATSHSYGVNLVGGAGANTLLLVDFSGGGSLGVGANPGEGGTFTTVDFKAGDATFGDSIVTTTFNAQGGTIHHNADIGTLNLTNGTFYQQKNNATTLNMWGGRYFWNAADAITTLALYGGVLDLSLDGRSRTITTLNWYGGSIYDPGNNLSVGTLNRFKGGTWQIS